MKKRIVMLVVGCMLLMTACGKNSDTSSKETAAPVTEEVEQQNVEENSETKEDASKETESTEGEEISQESENTSNEGENTSQESEAGTQSQEEQGEVIALAELYQQITDGGISLVSPMLLDESNSDFIYNYYGIDVTALEEYVFEVSEEATSAEMVIMFKVKDEGDIASMKEQLEGLLSDKCMELDNYLPDQYEIAARSKVQVDGNYLFLIVSENSEAINTIISTQFQVDIY